MRRCEAGITDETLTAYWSGDLDAGNADALEDHVFACDACSARLDDLAGLSQGVAALARQGRLSGLLSHAVFNRLQRDGVRVRLYTLEPGEMVPCAAFPGDDLVVTSLRADFSGTSRVKLSIDGPIPALYGVDEIPVAPSQPEVLLVLPGAVVRETPSTRLHIRLTAAEDDRVLGEYVLDHTHQDPAPGAALSH